MCSLAANDLLAIEGVAIDDDKAFFVGNKYTLLLAAEAPTTPGALFPDVRPSDGMTRIVSIAARGALLCLLPVIFLL
jgi:hypothetical protein